MSKNRNYLIIGTAENYHELINGKPFYSYLEQFHETHTIISLNEVILLPEINKYFLDIIMTIDFYTWEYLQKFPHLQNKMCVDATVKKYFDKKNVLQDVKNIFYVDEQIHRENTGKLYLNKSAPTVLQCALNLCLIKAILNNCLSETTVRLWGVALSVDWKHCYKHGQKDVPKDVEMIKEMRRCTYIFKKFFNLNTLNKNTTLDLTYEDPVKLISRV